MAIQLKSKHGWLHSSSHLVKRIDAATLESIKLGHGGIAYISQLFGRDPKTIQQGKQEIEHPPAEEDLKRQRKKRRPQASGSYFA